VQAEVLGDDGGERIGAEEAMNSEQLKSLKQLREFAAACSRVIANNGFTGELATELKRSGVEDGVGVRAQDTIRELECPASSQTKVLTGYELAGIADKAGMKFDGSNLAPQWEAFANLLARAPSQTKLKLYLGPRRHKHCQGCCEEYCPGVETPAPSEPAEPIPEVDFGTPDEVIVGLDRINAHNAALKQPAPATDPFSESPSSGTITNGTGFCQSTRSLGTKPAPEKAGGGK
jgi:hypothetical protein